MSDSNREAIINSEEYKAARDAAQKREIWERDVRGALQASLRESVAAMSVLDDEITAANHAIDRMKASLLAAEKRREELREERQAAWARGEAAVILAGREGVILQVLDEASEPENV